MNTFRNVAWLGPLCSGLIWAQGSGAFDVPKGPGLASQVPARIVVTLGHHYGKDVAVLTQDELTVTQRFDPRRVTNLTPLRGEHGALELFVLVDNCSSCEPGTKIGELRRFIQAQRAATAVGVASIHNGNLELIEKPTTDHDRAAMALDTPTGSKPVNPFPALEALIRGWAPTTARRAVLMISNGFNPTATTLGEDASADRAVEAAERAGVTIYAIYHPSADYESLDYSKIYAGQVQLAHVAGESGGEAYFLGIGPLPPLAPFLADISDHLSNQYLLEFLASPEETGAGLVDVTVKCKVPDVELVVPAKAALTEFTH